MNQSLGQMLLDNMSTTDYILYLHDSQHVVKCAVHRAILELYSTKFVEIIKNNYFQCCLKVVDGYIPAMLELLQFMYLRSFNLISENNIDKVKTLCVFLEMPKEFSMIKNNKNQEVDHRKNKEAHDSQKLYNLQFPDDLTCIVKDSFLPIIRNCYHSNASKFQDEDDEEEIKQYQENTRKYLLRKPRPPYNLRHKRINYRV